MRPRGMSEMLLRKMPTGFSMGPGPSAAAWGRSGQQCDRPAVRFCPAPRCDWHGGRSTGARMPEGIQRILHANWKHGERTAQAEKEASRLAVHIRRCEDALRTLGAISGNQRVGRWPSAYRPIKTQADVEAFVEELLKCGMIYSRTGE